MTRVVSITRSGPRFQEPRTLVEQLEASVAYHAEKGRQLETAGDLLRFVVPASELPSEFALAEVERELWKVVSR